MDETLLAALCTVALATTGCFDPADAPADTDAATATDASSGATATDGLPGATARVRVIHASPDAGPVDVYTAGDNVPTISALEYGGASDWLDIASGDLVVEVRPAGAPADSAPVYTSGALALVDGDDVSVVAAGLLADTGDDAFRLLPVVEQWGTELAGRARVRIVHAGADAPPIEVGGLEGGPIALEPYADGEAAGIPVDAVGGDRLEVSASGAVVTTFTTPAIADGDTVLVVATGLLGKLAREDDGFGLVAVGQGGALGLIRQDPELFTLHGARDAVALENCLGSEALAADIAYGEIQNARVSPGTYDATIYDYPAGCTGDPLSAGSVSTGELEAGERYLLLLTGEQESPEGDPVLQVVTLQDRFTLDDEMGGRFRFVHGASAEQIFVGSVTNAEIVTNNVYTDAIGWRSESSEETTLMMGSYRLGVADATTVPDPPVAPLEPLVQFDFVVAPGDRQWGVVSGDPAPETGDGPIQLMVVDTTTPGWGVTLTDPT